MANYVKFTDFQAKDSLTTGDPLKIIKGQEINDEFNAIQTAIATKADLASPALLGNPTAPTQALGNNSTRLASTAFVNNAIGANQANVAITGGTIAGVAISSSSITGGTVSGLATDLAVADGGTGSSSFTTNAVLLGNGTSALQTVAPSTIGNILTSNGTTWTSAAPASIILTSSVNTNSTTLALSSGSWNVQAYYRYYDDNFPDISLIIDGVTVDSVPNKGDPTGSSYIMLMGTTIVSGGRTITISATNAGDTPRLLVVAIRI
jgi:hypothetical protein